MFNKRVENFLKRNNLTISPLDYHKTKEESKVRKSNGALIHTFHDMNGIQHYQFNNKDYMRKILRVKIAIDSTTGEFPVGRRVSNLKNIIRTYINKNRILKETLINNGRIFEIRYDILFTANNTIKSYQYWIDELAYTINDNSTILLDELSLDVSANNVYKKIIPQIDTNQFINRRIKPINNNLDKLNNYELATIGREYQKDDILPPYELAVELKFGDEFFKKNSEYYDKEVSTYAHNFLQRVRRAKILKKEMDMSKIVRR